MKVICEDASAKFCQSLEIVGCCDFYDGGVAYVNDDKTVRRFADEYEVIDGVVRSMVCNGTTCKDLCCRLLMREPIQLLHDLSIQMGRLHRDGLSFTDVDICDIVCVDGRFCIANTQKVVEFNRDTGYGTLTFPPDFGRFRAPELWGISVIPAVDAFHRNSAVWSIGMMFANYVFGINYDDGSGDVEISDRVYEKLSSRLYKPTSIVNIIKRCLHPVPSARMLIVV